MHCCANSWETADSLHKNTGNSQNAPMYPRGFLDSPLLKRLSSQFNSCRLRLLMALCLSANSKALQPVLVGPSVAPVESWIDSLQIENYRNWISNEKVFVQSLPSGRFLFFLPHFDSTAFNLADMRQANLAKEQITFAMSSCSFPVAWCFW